MNKFNLTEEPWIPCLMLKNNETKELSLFQVLSQAHEIKEITDNSPLVVVSLHRLLLTILHRNFGPKSFEEWKNLWKQGSWNAEKLKDYFDNRCKDRFNLFDDERPFYQYPKVTKKEGIEADIVPLDVLMQEKATGNNGTLFDHSFEANSQTYSPAIAARCLIARQSFSFAGGVSFPFNFSNGLLISGFSVLAIGQNLFETLSLNLIIYHRDKPIPIQDDDDDISDIPFWEREKLVQATEKDKDGTLPLGYLDYLTWQSRRIKLIQDEEKQGVKSCQLQQNFKLKEVATLFDPFKVYVKGDNGFYGIKLREDKSLWRNSHTLLQQSTSIENRSSLFSHLAKVESFVRNSEIEGVKNHSFSIFGVINKEANVKSWTQERLPLPLEFLDNDELLEDLETAIKFAEEIEKEVLKPAIKKLAEILKSQSGSFSAVSIYWGSLEIEFKKMTLELPEKKDEAMCQWFEFVDKTAKQSFNDTANSLSGSAIEQKAIVEAEKEFKIEKHILLNGTKNGKKSGNSIYRHYLSVEEKEVRL